MLYVYEKVISVVSLFYFNILFDILFVVSGAFIMYDSINSNATITDMDSSCIDLFTVSKLVYIASLIDLTVNLVNLYIYKLCNKHNNSLVIRAIANTVIVSCVVYSITSFFIANDECSNFYYNNELLLYYANFLTFIGVTYIASYLVLSCLVCYYNTLDKNDYEEKEKLYTTMHNSKINFIDTDSSI